MNNDIVIKLKYNKETEINLTNLDSNFFQTILNIDLYFEIFINEKQFFVEPNFPIIELIIQLKEWDLFNNFYYKSLESDEYPIIAIIKNNNKYYLDSCWKNPDFKSPVPIQDIESLINTIIDTTESELKLKKVNLTSILTAYKKLKINNEV